MKQKERRAPFNTELIACHECDELQRIPPLAPGQAARCRICQALLLRNPKGGLDRPLALFLSALILLLLANTFPFMTLEIQGQQEITTILGTSQVLYQAGMGALAVVVFLTSILAPALIISSALYVLLAIRFGVSLPAVRLALSWISHLRPWVMLDVYMLGVLVAFVKLDKMASLHIGLSLFAFIGLIVLSTAAMAAFEPQLLWRQLAGQRST